MRLVASIATEVPLSKLLRSSAAPTTCSTLSSTSRTRRCSSAWATLSASGAAGDSRIPSEVAIAEMTRSAPDRGKVDERNAVRVEPLDFASGGDRQATLADAARAGECDEPRAPRLSASGRFAAPQSSRPMILLRRRRHANELGRGRIRRHVQRRRPSAASASKRSASRVARSDVSSFARSSPPSNATYDARSSSRIRPSNVSRRCLSWLAAFHINEHGDPRREVVLVLEAGHLLAGATQPYDSQ